MRHGRRTEKMGPPRRKLQNFIMNELLGSFKYPLLVRSFPFLFSRDVNIVFQEKVVTEGLSGRETWCLMVVLKWLVYWSAWCWSHQSGKCQTFFIFFASEAATFLFYIREIQCILNCRPKKQDVETHHLEPWKHASVIKSSTFLDLWWIKSLLT